MIVLRSIRLDVTGRFQYRIEISDGRSLLFSDPAEVAAELLRLGVEDPEPLVAHVRTWGVVEIVSPRRR